MYIKFSDPEPFCLLNFRIRNPLDIKPSDPEPLGQKTFGSGSFEKKTFGSENYGTIGTKYIFGFGSFGALNFRIRIRSRKKNLRIRIPDLLEAEEFAAEFTSSRDKFLEERAQILKHKSYRDSPFAFIRAPRVNFGIFFFFFF